MKMWSERLESGRYLGQEDRLRIAEQFGGQRNEFFLPAGELPDRHIQSIGRPSLVGIQSTSLACENWDHLRNAAKPFTPRQRFMNDYILRQSANYSVALYALLRRRFAIQSDSALRKDGHAGPSQFRSPTCPRHW